MAEYKCEDGFELAPGNVPGRGFANMNQINSKKFDIMKQFQQHTFVL